MQKSKIYCILPTISVLKVHLIAIKTLYNVGIKIIEMGMCKMQLTVAKIPMGAYLRFTVGSAKALQPKSSQFLFVKVS